MNENNYLDNVRPFYWDTCERSDIDGSSSEKRIPICLCLDLSGSMWNDRHGTPSIERLKEGIRRFITDIRSNEQGRSAEIAVVGFVDKGVILQDFMLADSFTNEKIQKLIDSLLSNYDHLPAKIRRSGDLEAGIQQSLCVLDARKAMYQDYGVPYCQPMLVVMTDGVPTRKEWGQLTPLDASRLSKMIEEIARRRNSRKLTVIAVYCERGSTEDGAAVAFLKNLINDNDEVYKINDREAEGFDKFFVFLSMSVSAASQGKAIDVAKFNAKMGGADFESVDQMRDFYNDSDSSSSVEASSNEPEEDISDIDDLLKNYF